MAVMIVWEGRQGRTCQITFSRPYSHVRFASMSLGFWAGRPRGLCADSVAGDCAKSVEVNPECGFESRPTKDEKGQIPGFCACCSAGVPQGCRVLRLLTRSTTDFENERVGKGQRALAKSTADLKRTLFNMRLEWRSGLFVETKEPRHQ